MNWKLTSTVAVLSAAISLQAASARELTYASYLPPNYSTIEDGLVPFFDRVAKATNGELTFKGFWGGAMGGPKELLDNVGNNTVDAAGIVDAYIKSSIPHAALFSGMARPVTSDLDMLAFSGAANEQLLLNCPECVQDFERNNAVLLALTATAPYFIMCTDKASTLDELKGKKIRAVSTIVPLVTNIGAVPVSITTAEMYEAMQRGQADCTTGATSWLSDYKLSEFVRSLIDMPVNDYVSSGTLVLNRDVWDDLSPEHRTVIIEELPQMIADANFANLQEAHHAVEETKKLGLEVHEPDAALLEIVEAYRDQSWSDAKELGKATDISATDEIVDGYRASVEKWRGIMAEIGMDKDAFAEALRREVFSKLQH